DPKWLPILFDGQTPRHTGASVRAAAVPMQYVLLDGDAEQIALQMQVDNLIEAHRLHGHHGADIDPLGRPRRADVSELRPEHWGLGPMHFDRRFHTSGLSEEQLTL